jgi:hypothetical protein
MDSPKRHAIGYSVPCLYDTSVVIIIIIARQQSVWIPPIVGKDERDTRTTTGHGRAFAFLVSRILL